MRKFVVCLIVGLILICSVSAIDMSVALTITPVKDIFIVAPGFTNWGIKYVADVFNPDTFIVSESKGKVSLLDYTTRFTLNTSTYTVHLLPLSESGYTPNTYPTIAESKLSGFLTSVNSDKFTSCFYNSLEDSVFNLLEGTYSVDICESESLIRYIGGTYRGDTLVLIEAVHPFDEDHEFLSQITNDPVVFTLIHSGFYSSISEFAEEISWVL